MNFLSVYLGRLSASEQAGEEVKNRVEESSELATERGPVVFFVPLAQIGSAGCAVGLLILIVLRVGDGILRRGELLFRFGDQFHAEVGVKITGIFLRAEIPGRDPVAVFVAIVPALPVFREVGQNGAAGKIEGPEIVSGAGEQAQLRVTAEIQFVKPAALHAKIGQVGERPEIGEGFKRRTVQLKDLQRGVIAEGDRGQFDAAAAEENEVFVGAEVQRFEGAFDQQFLQRRAAAEIQRGKAGAEKVQFFQRGVVRQIQFGNVAELGVEQLQQPYQMLISVTSERSFALRLPLPSRSIRERT